jgi:nucleoside 2-deoxyribosyltransferase
MQDGKPEIYLAGPEVFLPDPMARAGEMRAVCARYGAIGRFPLDNQTDVDDPDPDRMAARISRADEDLLRSCDAVVANMAPFRGPSTDPGTIYEIGFARGLGKPVVGWTTDWRRYGEKVADLMPMTRDGDVLRDEAGMACRDYGQIDNLMIVKGVAAVLGSFEEAVAHVVWLLRGQRLQL